MHTQTLSQQKKEAAALGIATVIASAIKEAGSIPSGHLYAMVSQFGISLSQYEQFIAALKAAGKVKERNHLLTWIN